MEPNFHALQLIAEIAIGIVGFSAILIALSRSSDVFSGPDNFRVRLLTYSAFGAMFGGLLPFGIFNINNVDLCRLFNFIFSSKHFSVYKNNVCAGGLIT